MTGNHKKVLKKIGKHLFHIQLFERIFSEEVKSAISKSECSEGEPQRVNVNM